MGLGDGFLNKSRERKRKKEEEGGRSIELKRISLSLSPRVAMPSCRVTCRSFSSLGRNKCVHPSILPCNNPFRLICSNVACSGSRYPMNRSVCTLFYHRALHVDESAGFLWYTLHWFRGEGRGRRCTRGRVPTDPLVLSRKTNK